jgi:hypothetical protein
MLSVQFNFINLPFIELNLRFVAISRSSILGRKSEYFSDLIFPLLLLLVLPNFVAASIT